MHRKEVPTEMAVIDLNAPGENRLFIGNEAIARGALEAGIGWASAYPGTPSSEVIGSLAEVAKEQKIYVEWSVNEKVALEAAAAASYAGIRALAAMKMAGLNVAQDFLASLVLTGIGKKGLVLMVGDDPEAHSSSEEMDSRGIARVFDIPLLEPGDFQEAKDMMKWAFELSEELGTVVMLRSVTRIAHARGNVRLGDLPQIEQRAIFENVYNPMSPSPTAYMPVPSPLRHAFQHLKLDKARSKYEGSPFNRYSGPEKPDLLLITCGSGWLYSQDAVSTLGLEKRVGILKLGTLWPLPEKLVQSCLQKTNRVLFIEEIDPFLEGAIMEFSSSLSPERRTGIFYGKHTRHINSFGELTPDSVINAIVSILDIKYEPITAEYINKLESIPKNFVIERMLTFCPGCPHRASYWAMKTALRMDGRDGFITGDIGCYSMGLGPAGFFQNRTQHSMGGGAGVANGFGQLWRFGFNQPVMAVCGDSTFFHAAIPALINGVHNKANFILVVLDNSATAMTGFQPHPASDLTAMGEDATPVSIEVVCEAIGAQVEICDPFDLKSTIYKLLKLLEQNNGVRVAIMRRTCELVRGRREAHPFKVRLIAEKCIGEECGCNRLCTRVFRCPALVWDPAKGKTMIDEVICTECGVCADICPEGAIVKETVI
jgi:indolepyruvate ferredoxin oxidoreductase alpha subunit